MALGSRQEQTEPSGATVLVADDDASIRGALEKLLSAEGLQVATAGDGRGALAADPR